MYQKGFSKNSFHNFCLAFLIFLCCVFSVSVRAEFSRATSFDDRGSCEKTKGVWREFGNSLGDSCEAKFDQFAIAPQVVTYACDCGKNKCWNGEKCVLMQEYKQLFDKRQEKNKRKIEEAKNARSEEYRENSNERLQGLISKVVADPNNSNNQNSNNNMAQFSDKLPADSNKNSSANGTGLGKYITIPEDVKNSGATNNAAIPFPTPVSNVPDQVPVVVTPALNSESISAGPTPFFLQQQEKAKQESSSGASNKATKPDSSLPSLPQIPLPQ